MKIEKLSETVSVSDQIDTGDIQQLAAAGVEILVCNRPDNEAAGQPTFAEIAKAAAEAGMEAVHIPFTSGQMGAEHVAAFQQYATTRKRLHAYCRTGNRCKNLWLASRENSGEPEAPPPSSPADDKAPTTAAKPHYDIVIVGAGSGGITVAASLLKRKAGLRIALIDPATEHYYQPGWTLVGGGVFSAASTRRPMGSLIPPGVTWIQRAVSGFEPSDNKVVLSDHSEIYYGQLVIAAGLKLDWEAIEGLPETLGKNGVTSNYRYDLAPYTWQLVQEMQSGKALFTQPPMPIKCAGAPQKAMYLSADHWLRNDRAIDLHFYNAGAVLFGVEAYVPALMKYVEKYHANLHFQHSLCKIDGESKTAWFNYTDADGKQDTIASDFDMIHVCPPQCAPDFIRQSTLADAAGWLDVDPATLRHTSGSNIWGLGDVTNTPNAKTMAAVRKQAPVVAQNICAVLDGNAPEVIYDGYGSCPLTVERGKIVLAEFGYGGKLIPTFPKWLNEGTRPTRFAWYLKAKVLPWVYWSGMLKGHEWLAAPQRKASV